MKSFFAFLIILILSVLSFYIYSRRDTESLVSLEVTPTHEITPTVVRQNEPTKTVSSGGYHVSWLIVRDFKKIQLFSNLEEKLTSSEAINKNECNFFVSGSLWREDGKHLGLFVTDSKIRQSEITSDLYNGYFSMDGSGNSTISGRIPTRVPDIAIQAGPLIMLDNKFQEISSASDQNARRVLIAKDKVGAVVFIVFYDKNSTISGPKLSELKQLISDLEKNTSLKFSSILNIDGGSHSAFITDEVKLPEIAMTGSYFCIKH